MLVKSLQSISNLNVIGSNVSKPLSQFVVTPGDINETNIDIVDFSNKDKISFKASDGNLYCVQDEIERRLSNIVYKVYGKKSKMNIFQKFINWISSKTNKIYKQTDIEWNMNNENKSFYEMTGYCYNNDNVEKFLKGEIKLKSELMYEKSFKENVEVTPLPIITEPALFNKTHSEIKLCAQDKKMLNEIKNDLPFDYQQKMDNLLYSGKLHERSSNSGNSILETLYKIITEKRVDEIDKIELLKECLNILDNPEIITQRSEDIPDEYKKQFKLKLGNDKKLYEDEINRRGRGMSSTCAAASIEYLLASAQSANFCEIIENITSKNKSSQVIYNAQKPTDNFDIILNENNTKYEKRKDSYLITLKPDEDAYFCAEIQNKYKDEGERSIIDILMQSTIMQLGSGNTYNSLVDTRGKNEFTTDNGGLTEPEIDYVMQLLFNNEPHTKLYQIVNDDGKRKSSTSKKQIEDDLIYLLESGKTIIAGITYVNDDNKICGGHELIINGYTKNINNQTIFICNDSDDNLSSCVTCLAEELLDNLHHIKYC